MSAFFCLRNRKRVRRFTTSAASGTCCASRANESMCSEAPSIVLNWKHAWRPFSCPTTALKCRRTASRSFWTSAWSCLFMVMHCALANDHISLLWRPAHSIICCNNTEQRGCSERSRNQSSKTLSSSLSCTNSSVNVVAGCSSTSIPSQCSAAPDSKCSPLLPGGAPTTSCSSPPCSGAPT